MAKLDRILQKIFGSSGSTAEFGKVGSLADGAAVYTKDLETIQAGAQFLRGLFGLTASVDEPPRIQDINSLYLLFSSQLKYIFQSGIAEYIATEEYYIGSLCQIAGVIYVSQSGAGSSPNVNNPPATDDGTYWLELLDADGLLAKLLTVDGSGSGLDADKVRATTPGTGGLELLAISALGTNWASALGAALATNVKHVMGAGLGADWQGLLEAAANTAVKNNDSATLQAHAASYFATAVQGAKADISQSTSRNESFISLTNNVPVIVPAGTYQFWIDGGGAAGNFTKLEIYTDAGYWRQVSGAYVASAGGLGSDSGGYVVSDGVNYRVTAGGGTGGTLILIRMQ
jgi:hypothetical protein